MDDVTGRRLVSDYLSRLQAAAWRLPAQRRTALVDDVRGQVEARVTGDESEAEVLAALAAVGEPADLVAAETARAPLPADPPPRRHLYSEWGSREVAAVLLLCLGGIALPLVGPVVGLVVAWTAAGWTRLQKSVATALAVGTPALLAVPTRSAAAGHWTLLGIVLLLPLAGLAPAGYLAWVLRRSARAGNEAPIAG